MSMQDKPSLQTQRILVNMHIMAGQPLDVVHESKEHARHQLTVDLRTLSDALRRADEDAELVVKHIVKKIREYAHGVEVKPITMLAPVSSEGHLKHGDAQTGMRVEHKHSHRQGTIITINDMPEPDEAEYNDDLRYMKDGSCTVKFDSALNDKTVSMTALQAVTTHSLLRNT